MQSNGKKIILMASVLVFAAASGILSLAWGQIGRNNTAALAAEALWREEVTKREEAKTLDRTMKSIEKERAMLDSHFARSSDIVPFLDTLERLGTEAGANAEVFSVDADRDGSSIIAGVKAEGSFQALYKMLLLLENSQYAISLESADFQTPDGGDDASLSPEWTASFRIRLLSFMP